MAAVPCLEIAALAPGEQAPVAYRNFAAMALRGRLGPQAGSASWAAYLPPQFYKQAKDAAPGGSWDSAADTDSTDDASSCGEVALALSTSPSSAQRSALDDGLSVWSSESARGTPPAHAAARPLPGAVLGQVWRLSQTADGSRQVQDALDAAGGAHTQVAIADELRGHVAKALRCPHANHVLQKLIDTGAPEEVRFISEELLARPGLVSQAARHRYGCRVIQHLLQRCPLEMVSQLVQALLADCLALCCHPFGTYVVQNLLQRGTVGQRCCAGRALEAHAAHLPRSRAGCGVLVVAMEHLAREDAVRLARAVIQEANVLESLPLVRQGSLAALRMLRVLPGPEAFEARARLEAARPALRSSRYGREVLAHLEGFRGA